MLPKKKGFHRHHIVPKHQGGSDDDENIVYLTPKEHAKAHLELFELHGRYEDAQAYNSLKKHWLGARQLNGYKQSEQHIRKRREATDYLKISESLKGRISPTKGMKFEYKPKPKISESLLGKPKSDETKRRISKSLKGRSSKNKMEIYCVHCKNRVPLSRLDRHGIGKKVCVVK